MPGGPEFAGPHCQYYGPRWNQACVTSNLQYLDDTNDSLGPARSRALHTNQRRVRAGL
jgi:hypothetical protein